MEENLKGNLELGANLMKDKDGLMGDGVGGEI
jgi:hypothetical protein